MYRKYGLKPSVLNENIQIFVQDQNAVKNFLNANQINQNNIAKEFNLLNIVNVPLAYDAIDQGSINSCTANAIAYAYAFDQIKQNNKEQFFPSRLFIYYNERLIGGASYQDSGASFLEGMQCLTKYGACSEIDWPYDVSKLFNVPPQNIYDQALLSKPIKYYIIDLKPYNTVLEITNYIKSILQGGNMIILGFVAYSNFESETVTITGVLSMPSPSDQMIGAHSVCIIGYNDAENAFLCKNSWGYQWGMKGNFYLPYDYVANPNLVIELWIIESVNNPDNISNFSRNFIYPDPNLYVPINEIGIGFIYPYRGATPSGCSIS